MKSTLGWHWILDAFDCQRGRISNLEHLKSVLTDMPSALGLTRVGEPQVFDHLPEDPHNRCLVGLTMIAESHLSIHARPGAGVLHADLFSCAPFDQTRAFDFLQGAYDFSRWEVQSLDRGAVNAPLEVVK